MTNDLVTRALEERLKQWTHVREDALPHMQGLAAALDPIVARLVEEETKALREAARRFLFLYEGCPAESASADSWNRWLDQLALLSVQVGRALNPPAESAGEEVGRG